MTKIFILTLLSIVSIHVHGQEDLDLLNQLPETKEIRSPEFNTVAKFNIYLDSVYRKIYIQDTRTSKEGKIHFYQWLYEIPFENLEFNVKISGEEISIVIETPDSGNTFIRYWFQNNKISSIYNQNEIKLGNWENTVGNLKTIENVARKLTEYFSVFKLLEKPLIINEPGTYKYFASNVTKLNVKMDNNLKIGEYFFDPFFNSDNKPKSTQLLNTLVKEIKKLNLENNSPIAVLIYSGAEGNLETIQLINTSSNYPIEVSPSKIKSINNTNSKTKSLLLLY